jgi:hypothetical protein
MDAGSARWGVCANGGREMLVVAGLAVAGLVLAALAAFTPWYAATGDPVVIEVRDAAVATTQR